MMQLSKSRVLRQSAVSSRSAVAFKVRRGYNGHWHCQHWTSELNRAWLGLCFLQPVRAVSIKAATEDVEVTNNGAVGASAAANMLDFEELSDIVRSVHRKTAAASSNREPAAD